MVVDWARRCHHGTWRLFKNRPDILTPGRFYFVPEDTPYYPGWHNFTNADWTYNGAGQIYIPPELGEDRSLRRGYSKGALGGPMPPATFLGAAECLAEGETVYPASERAMPMGVDSRCYPPGASPILPPGGMVCWLKPETLPPGGEGSPQTLWNDATEFNNRVTSYPGSISPLRTLAFLNGFDAVIFNRSVLGIQSLTWGLQGDGSIHALNIGKGHTIIVVATLGGPAGLKTGPAVNRLGLGSVPALGVHPVQIRAAIVGGAVSGNTGFAPLESHVWHCSREADNLDLGVDGVVLASGIVPAGNDLDLTTLSVDNHTGAVQRSTVLSEVMVWPFRLGPDNLALAVQYARLKYAL